MATEALVRTLAQLDVDYPGRYSDTTALQLEIIEGTVLQVSEVGADLEAEGGFDGMFSVLPIPALITALWKLDPDQFRAAAMSAGAYDGYRWDGD